MYTVVHENRIQKVKRNHICKSLCNVNIRIHISKIALQAQEAKKEEEKKKHQLKNNARIAIVRKWPIMRLSS